MKVSRSNKNKLAERGLNSCMAYLIVIFQCFPGIVISVGAEEAMPSDKETVAVADRVEVDEAEVVGTTEFPPGAFILGARFSDDDFAGSAEAMVPILFNPDIGVVFLDARTSANDNNEEETNLGLAWRKLVNQKAIVGLNAFWDSRWTASGNRFDQLGLGAEIMTHRFDARFNYYIPEGDKKLANSFETAATNTSTRVSSTSTVEYGDLGFSGNSIVQEVNTTVKETRVTQVTTTRFLFEQYEQALEGWDAEIGILLDPLSFLGEVRVFAGYQDFENPFGPSFRGAKGRVEVKVTPRIILDGEVFEEEALNGTDFYVGARVYTPMDLKALAQGKNPFKEQQVESGLAGRIADPVIRDLKIQAAVSDAEEVEEKRTVSTTSSSRTTTETNPETGGRATRATIMSNLIVVDSDNASGVEDGTFENPYNTFKEGETDVENGLGSIYVFGRGVDYTTGNGGLKLPDGASAYGSGASVLGFGGRSLAAGVHPVVMGTGNAPVFTLGEGSTVSGFEIMNTGGGSKIKNGPNGYSYDVAQAAIFSKNKSGITIKDNIFNGVSYGAVVLDKLSSPTDSFTALIEGNSVGRKGVSKDGVVIDTAGASGSADITVTENTLSKTGGNGLNVISTGYDSIKYLSRNNVADKNAEHGMRVDLEADLAVVAMMFGDSASNNAEDEGVHLDTRGKGTGTLFVSGVTANNNGQKDDQEGVDLDADHKGAVSITVVDVTAKGNGDDGIEIEADSEKGDISIAVSRVTVNGNDDDGLDVEADSTKGDVTLLVSQATANNNKDSGMDLEVDGDNKGDLLVRVSDSTANGNREDGVRIEGDNYKGDVVVEVVRTTANNNKEAGVHVHADTAYNGDAKVTLRDVKANSNMDGIQAEARIVRRGPDVGKGEAIITATDVTANKNKDQGMELSAINDVGGAATATLTDLTARNNRGLGIFAAASVHHPGPVRGGIHGGAATLDATGIVANGNQGGAILRSRNQGAGKATTTLNDVTTNDNGKKQIGLIATAEVQGTGSPLSALRGDAKVSATDVTANGNGSGAIFTARTSGNGDAKTTLAQITANNNRNGTGIEANAFVGVGPRIRSLDGKAVVDATDLKANNNVTGVALTARTLGTGDAKIKMNGVDADGNKKTGVMASASVGFHPAVRGARGDASISGGDVEADNNGNGVELTAKTSGSGDAKIDLDGVDADHNKNTGITAVASVGFNPRVRGGSGKAVIEGSDWTANDNKQGMDLSASTVDSGKATIELEGVTAKANSGKGLVADATINRNPGKKFVENDALVKITGGKFNDNQQGAVITAHSQDMGDADIKLFDVVANSNTGGHGLEATAFVKAKIGGSGDATVKVDGGTFNGNNKNGLVAKATTESAGDAEVDLDSVTANSNGGSGLVAKATVTGRTKFSSATIKGSDLKTNNNGSDGMDLSATTDTGLGGGAEIKLDTVVASGNSTGTGIKAHAEVISGIRGSAKITIVDGRFNNNLVGGKLTAKTPGSGDAKILLSEITANGNSKGGLKAVAEVTKGRSGEAIIKLDDGRFNGNGGTGLELDASTQGSGKADILIENVVANNNRGDYGIKAKAEVVGGKDKKAEVTGSNVTANANSDGGMKIVARTDQSGKANIELSDLTAKNNTAGEGIILEAEANNSAKGANIDLTTADTRGNEVGVYARASTLDSAGDADITLDDVTSKNNTNEGIDAKSKAVNNGSDARVEVLNSSATGNSPNAVVKAVSNTGTETETVSPAIP